MTDATNGQVQPSDATGANPQGADVAGTIGPGTAAAPASGPLDESVIQRSGGPPAAELNRREFASGVDPRGIDELERDGAISKAEADNLRSIKEADSRSAVGVAGWGESALGAPRPPKLDRFKDVSGKNVLGFQRSTTPPTVGRVLHFFRKLKGDRGIQGPLCAHVTSVSGPFYVNVCVLPSNGGPDAKVEVATSCGVYQPIEPAARMEGFDQLPEYWAEWMPFQVGQAQRTQQSEGHLSRMVGRLEGAVRKLAGHLNNDGSGIADQVNAHLDG